MVSSNNNHLIGDGEQISLDHIKRRQAICRDALAALTLSEQKSLVANPTTDETTLAAVNLGAWFANYWRQETKGITVEGITYRGQDLCIGLRDLYGLDPDVLNIVLGTAVDVVEMGNREVVV